MDLFNNNNSKLPDAPTGITLKIPKAISEESNNISVNKVVGLTVNPVIHDESLSNDLNLSKDVRNIAEIIYEKFASKYNIKFKQINGFESKLTCQDFGQKAINFYNELNVYLNENFKYVRQDKAENSKTYRNDSNVLFIINSIFDIASLKVVFQ